MAKPRSWAADYATYLAIRVAVCVLQAFPLKTGMAFSRWLARLAYVVDRRHREAALDNLRQAFPGQYTEAQLSRLVLRVYEHFAGVLVEIVHLPRLLHPNSWQRYARLAEGKRIVATLLSGHPVVVVTGHYGNWEMAGYALAMFGFKSHAIARPLDNPYLDAFLRRFREKTGQKIIAKKGEFDRLEEVLRGGGIVCTLGDQDAGQKGLFVDFFGRPASTHKAIALLAMEHRAALLVAGGQKVGQPLQYAIRGVDALLPGDLEQPGASVRSITQRLTTALERLIREDVSQYLWLHRRWKHQPARQRKAA